MTVMNQVNWGLVMIGFDAVKTDCFVHKDFLLHGLIITGQLFYTPTVWIDYLLVR